MADYEPTDRAALKRAADDLLKAARSEDRARDREERAREAEHDEMTDGAGPGGEGPGGEGPDEWDELLDRMGDPGETGVGTADERLIERAESAEAEAAEAKDRALRTTAEMENLRRRTQREVNDAKAFAISNFAREVLEVADNLQRTLASVPEGSDDPALTALKEGVEMTGRQLDRAMEKHGVRKLDPAGEKFDPNFHQAMFKVPNPDVPANSVVQVVQVGYALGPRVLRPAMVGVAEGGPKFVDPPADETTQDA